MLPPFQRPKIYLAGSGVYFPEERITNRDLLAKIDTTEEWLDSRIGIRERRKAPAEVNTSDLGALATRVALADAGWSPASVELLVCATSTPDNLIPATASFICQKIGMNPVAFDVNAACSGFVYGLAVAQSLMQTVGYRRALLCTAEKYTRVTDYTDRSTCVFFGDSAATVALQPEEPQLGAEVVDVTMRNYNEGAALVQTPVGGYFMQDGPRTKEIALEAFTSSAGEMLRRHGLAMRDIRAFMGHQANLRVLETVGEKLGVSNGQHWYNVDMFGNQGAAGVITTLCGGIRARAGELRHDDWLLCTVFGSGFTSGSALLRWIDRR